MHPAKSVGCTDMPFGRDTRVVPSDIVLDGPQFPTERKDFLGLELPVRCDASYHQISLFVVYML